MAVQRGKIGVTVGIPAYNEERNIGKLLEALLEQNSEVARIEEVLVVASGCTDKTAQIVESVAESDARLRLIIQEERMGKASAINEILRDALGEVIVLESADTIPGRKTLGLLITPFQDPEVGVVASRPVPVDNQHEFWGSMTHVLWGLHHEVSLQVPKAGEMFAFRSILSAIPDKVGADEDWIRHNVEKLGYRVVYEPRAIVFNAGPKTLGEFLKQRLRCNIQEVTHRRESSILVPTWQTTLMVKAFLAYLRGDHRRLWPLIFYSLLELMTRVYSLVRAWLMPVDLSIWQEIPSTKSVDLGPDTRIHEDD